MHKKVNEATTFYAVHVTEPLTTIPIGHSMYSFMVLRDSPSCPPSNEAQQEGWGLYSESLGFELGLFDLEAKDKRSIYHLIGFNSLKLLRVGKTRSFLNRYGSTLFTIF